MRLLIVFILASFFYGCDKALLGDEDSLVTLEENLAAPPALNDGWEVSTLTAQNIDPTPIRRLIQRIHEDPQNIHSMLIIRNNKLVAESYFDGWQRDRLHATRSVSKTFISTLVGIAVDKGKLPGVNEKVFDYFPEYAYLKTPQKNQIEVRHLLSMTSGLQWDEKTFDGDDPRNDEYRLEKSDDRLGYLFKKDMIANPGSVFEYNSGCPVAESAIVTKATGEDAEAFARKNLFDPLNITNYYWRRNDDGYITAIGPILLMSRDMAKLGQLFLDSGRWKGQQIISADWVSRATTTYSGNEDNATGYGYHWWTAKYTINNQPTRVVFARGSGGQYIFVVPSLQAVVVFTSGNYPPLQQAAPVTFLRNIILPAMH